MPQTSGNVSTYFFTNAHIIQHAGRRALLKPELLSGEDLQVGLDLLYTITSQWAGVGFPLWTRVFSLLGVQIGSPDVTCPPGTVECLDSYWRILQPYRGSCTVNAAPNTTLFGGQANADVVAAGPQASVTVNFGSATEIDTVGVLLGGSSSNTAALQLYVSTDGITFPVTPTQTLPSATYQRGQWTYFDLNPTLTPYALKIVNPGAGAWTLNQLQFALANGQDILNGPLNIDDYYNLPNKLFRSDRPNSMFQDRQVNGPVLKIWPVPNDGAFYNGTISALTRRYIQDPGSLTNILEVPQYWYETIIDRLATKMILEIPNPGMATVDAATRAAMLQEKQARIPILEASASKGEAIAWSENRNRAPIRLAPSIAPYTR